MLVIEASNLPLMDSPWPERLQVNLEELVRQAGLMSTAVPEEFRRYQIKQDAEGEVTEVVYTATIILRVLND